VQLESVIEAHQKKTNEANSIKFICGIITEEYYTSNTTKEKETFTSSPDFVF